MKNLLSVLVGDCWRLAQTTWGRGFRDEVELKNYDDEIVEELP
jgi:hypothetical protein